MYQIVAERENTILILDNGMIKSYPNDFYNELRLKTFNGERIILDIQSKQKGTIHITETYNRGIFNVEYMGEVIQFRDKNKVCMGVRQWLYQQESNIIEDAYVELWKNNNQSKVMQMMADFFGDRVKVVKNDTDENLFEVDGLFRINNQGTCFTKRDISNKWSAMCVVPAGKIRPFKIQTNIGEISLTETDVVILAKVGFLLDPKKIYDRVFFNQLSRKLQRVLKDEMKAELKYNGKERHAKKLDGDLLDY